MLLTIIATVLLVSVEGIFSYYWLQNLRKRIEGFYIGLYNGLDIPKEERYQYKLSQPYLLFFWFTSIPLMGLPILCLETGLILERRRAAREMTFYVHNRAHLDRNPETTKVFVTLPGLSRFKYSGEESHMLFPQTQPGSGLFEPDAPSSSARLSRRRRRAPAGLASPGATGRQVHHQGTTATPGLPYCSSGDAQDQRLARLAQLHGLGYPPKTSQEYQDLAKIWNAAGRP